jgi:hypothetical protein
LPMPLFYPDVGRHSTSGLGNFKIRIQHLVKPSMKIRALGAVAG